MARRVALLSMHTSPLASLGGKETGGMNVYIRELCRQLGRDGWEVDVFSRAQDPTLPTVQYPDEPGWRLIHVPAGPPETVDRRELFPFLEEYVAGIERWRREQGVTYDLIHSHYWLSGWAGLRLRQAWNLPLVHMFHTLGRLKDMATGDNGQREADNRGEVEQDVMDGADRIVAATPLDRQQMLDHYRVDPDRIAVVPCGVNLDLFHPIDQRRAREELDISADRRLLLFVGRLDPVKGLNVLLEAMCELTRRLRPCRAEDLSLAVIGGDRESHLEAMMTDLSCYTEIRRELGLEDLVVFIGSRSQEALPLYYGAAEVCVMPSLYESFGMVALEAMACGTPVIASRVGGLTYTVRDGETGFLVPERDPKALAARLEQLLTDDALRRRMGERAAEVAAEYSWTVVTDAIEALYEELLAERRRAASRGAESRRERCLR